MKKLLLLCVIACFAATTAFAADDWSKVACSRTRPGCPLSNPQRPLVAIRRAVGPCPTPDLHSAAGGRHEAEGAQRDAVRRSVIQPVSRQPAPQGASSRLHQVPQS